MMRRWLLTLFAAAVCPTLAAAQSLGEVVEYYHLDALGSVRVVTNQAGAVVRRHDFKPFGEEINVTFPAPDRKLFTGQERDSESALDYFGARYYRANLGRFTTLDPVGLNGLKLVNPQRFNRYNYATNTPLTSVDPDGRDAIVVNFSQGAPISGRRFGHNGIAVVFANGSVIFSDFGPGGAGGFTADPRVSTPPTLAAQVEFGSDGLPTRASLAAVAQELEGLEHAPPGSVQLAFFKTSASETAALASWIASSPAQWQNGVWAKFVLYGRNCGNYVREGMSNLRGFGSVRQPGLSIPNLDFLLFRMFADAFFRPVAATVTTEITGFRLRDTQIR
jgi:RHS repeat-associated protein